MLCKGGNGGGGKRGMGRREEIQEGVLHRKGMVGVILYIIGMVGRA
jgi:hypothetical protein